MTGQDTRNKRSLRWGWLAAGVIAAVVLAVVAFATLQPVKVLPRIRLAPAFTLTDQEGNRLTNEDLRGQLVLYNFTYTGCGARCGQLDETMRAVQAGLAREGASDIPISLITLTFDPERDTPAALQAHAQAVGADPSRWRFAAASPARTKDIIGGGFEAYYAPDGQGGFKFDPAFALVDGWGIIRAEYRGAATDPEHILRHIAVIQQEIRNSKGAAKVAYEAAHLFLCYAR